MHRILFQDTEFGPLGRVWRMGNHWGNRGEGLYEFRQLPFFAISYILNGAGEFCLKGETPIPISAGHLLVLLPQEAHRYMAHKHSPFDELYLIFDGPVFDLWHQQEVWGSSRVWRLTPIEQWLEKLEGLIPPPGELTPLDRLQQVCRLQGFLSQALQEQHRLTLSDSCRDWLAQACALLSQDLSAFQYGGKDIAKQLGLPYDAFRRKFKMLSGQSPAKWRDRQRIEWACDLLNHEELTISNVAEQTGFQTPYYFSRRFKELIGVTPSEFRRTKSQTVSAPEDVPVD